MSNNLDAEFLKFEAGCCLVNIFNIQQQIKNFTS
jgi:hypothetical protein